MKVNLKAFKKNLNYIKNLNAEMNMEAIKIYRRKEFLVVSGILSGYECEFKTPIIDGDDTFSIGLTTEDFKLMYSYLSNKNRDLDLVLGGNLKLIVSQAIKGKEVIEDTYEINYISLDTTKESKNIAISKKIDFDSLLESMKAVETLQKKSNILSSIGTGAFICSETKHKLCFIDNCAIVSFDIETTKPIGACTKVIDLADLTAYKKLIAKCVDLDVYIYFKKDSISFVSESITFNIPYKGDKYPLNHQNYFEEEVCTDLEVRDLTLKTGEIITINELRKEVGENIFYIAYDNEKFKLYKTATSNFEKNNSVEFACNFGYINKLSKALENSALELTLLKFRGKDMKVLVLKNQGVRVYLFPIK